MIKHNFKIAWRSIWNAKSYTIINILGLSAGLASFIIVLLYLNYELSYDSWSPELEKVYRVGMKDKGGIQNNTPAPLASFFAEKYPKIEAATSMQGAGEYEVIISTDEKQIYHNGFASADSLFLKVFPYHLIQGDRNTALNAPNSVIISEELAEKLFGSTNPMGQTVKVFNMMEGVVTGVIKLPETPSHRPIHLIMRDPYEKQNFFWNNYSFETYLKINQTISSAELEEDLNRIYFEERIKKDEDLNKEYKNSGNRTLLFTDAVPDIQNFSKHGNSNIKTVSVLFILAILLLVIGAINFSNLSIAKSLGKSREIGVRKVLGSGNWNLFWQFMAEAILQCVISLIIAMGIVLLSLPYVNSIFGLELKLGGNFEVLGQIGLCLGAIILISGLFPSILLSRFNLLKILNGGTSKGNKGLVLRDILVIFQFMVTSFFIIAIVVVNKQLDYIQSKDKGFSEEQLVRIEAIQNTRDTNFETVKEQLLDIPGVEAVAKTTNVPGDKFADSSTVNFSFNSEKYRMNSVKVSSDYFETLETPIVHGRNFESTGPDQHTKTAIINETAAASLNSENILGATIFYAGCEEAPMQIVGIVKDFNVLGFENKVQPAVFSIGNEACMFQSGGAILARLNTQNPKASIDKIASLWKQVEPGTPLRYSFLDDNFQKLFSSYYRLQKVISFFGIIAIVISIMGLFALTTFILKQRVKEIGVRKVLGAEITNIVALVSKDFLILVSVAILFSVPIGWYAMNKWLENFAYKTELSWWIFIVSGTLVLTIAFLTVSLKTIRTARKNPVKSLRTD
ncbi:putative ABC transport system permease protein [Gillisia sp. Hel1_33_143]|uniref:ABC transporter permease n=1 Tax=Gillisia sp. Hel1_33_143 TaxID=1336796 RepID=UPI00087B4907|nr:ABC transporter permease [Gillisia sp. Hel1_33_143]SDS75238.1 putative ABC transport system permease protein [Gillisia sp. Hel1_33_143]